jgi:hypothetical protein
MQKDIYSVVTAGFQTKELRIQHKGDRGKRMPVSDERLGKGCNETRLS